MILSADEIGLAARRRPDGDRLVGELDMERVAVGLGVHRHRRDAHPPGGLDDTAGDLAAIGDQDLLEHGHPGVVKVWRRPCRWSSLGGKYAEGIDRPDRQAAIRPPRPGR